MTSRVGPAQSKTFVILAPPFDDSNDEWNPLAVGDGSQVIDPWQVSHENLHDYSPNIVCGHGQWSPDLGLWNALLRIVSEAAVAREGCFAGEQAARSQRIAGSGERIERVIERPDLISRDAIRAAIDGSERRAHPQVGGVEIEEEADGAEGDRLRRRPLEIRESVLRAILFPQGERTMGEGLFLPIPTKGHYGRDPFGVGRVILSAGLEKGSARRNTAGRHFVEQMASDGKPSRHANLDTIDDFEQPTRDIIDRTPKDEGDPIQLGGFVKGGRGAGIRQYHLDGVFSLFGLHRLLDSCRTT